MSRSGCAVGARTCHLWKRHRFLSPQSRNLSDAGLRLLIFRLGILAEWRLAANACMLPQFVEYGGQLDFTHPSVLYLPMLDRDDKSSFFQNHMVYEIREAWEDRQVTELALSYRRQRASSSKFAGIAKDIVLLELGKAKRELLPEIRRMQFRSYLNRDSLREFPGGLPLRQERCQEV